MDRKSVFFRIKLITKSKAIFTYSKAQPYNSNAKSLCAAQFLIYCPLKWDHLAYFQKIYLESGQQSGDFTHYNHISVHSPQETEHKTDGYETEKSIKNKISGKCSLRAKTQGE